MVQNFLACRLDLSDINNDARPTVLTNSTSFALLYVKEKPKTS